MTDQNADFQIVPDERRHEAGVHRGRPPSPLWEAVRSGQTVLVPPKDVASFNGVRSSFRAKGYRLHVSKQPDGVLLWADRLNGEDTE
jgi:hypothetical protein